MYDRNHYYFGLGPIPKLKPKLANTVTDTETTFQRENLVTDKAELLQEGTFFLIHLFARVVLAMKKLEIEETKPTFIISVSKVEYWVVLLSLISNFFINETSLANKWMSFSSSNLALEDFTKYLWSSQNI